MSLNTQHILEVAAAIEKRSISGLDFDMGSFADVVYDDINEICSTTACMAGFSYMLNGHCDSLKQLVEDADCLLVGDQAQADMGISEGQRHEMFYELSRSDREVVAMLRNLAATGEVSW